jgi:RHS repeat-associated protein
VLDANEVVIQRVQMGYDDAGRKRWEKDGEGHQTDFTYDDAGQVEQELYPAVNGGPRDHKDYTYDANGNRETEANEEAETTKWMYDDANRLKTVVDPEEGESSYTYDRVGNRASLRYPNGVVADYVYDARNRLTDLHNHAGETTISRHTYTHWGDGNRATLTDQDDRVTTYEYDKLNRLEFEKQVAAGGGTLYDHKFVYDDVGNLLQKLDLTTSPATLLTELTYNAADQIASDGFDYDDRGNMLMEHRPEAEDENWTYEFDSQNRLTHAYDGTNNFTYEYDGDGHRVKQTVNLIVTEFVVDLNGGLSQVVADINSGGNLKVLYVRGDDLLSQLQSSEWHWYSYDGHGSTIALTDDSGDQADFYEYDAWGNPLDTAEHPPNRFRYTGQEEDGTGLYYLRARYYGPRLGRFGSRDPVMGSAQDPRTLHLYAYCLGDPGNHVDPSGLTLAEQVIVAAIIAMIAGSLATAVAKARGKSWKEALWIGAKTALVAFGVALGAAALTTVLESFAFMLWGVHVPILVEVGIPALINGLASAAEYVFTCVILDQKWSWWGIVVAFVVGALIGFFGGRMVADKLELVRNATATEELVKTAGDLLGYTIASVLVGVGVALVEALMKGKVPLSEVTEE